MDKDDKSLLETLKKLRAEVGNLKVQNAEYSQIVAELSDKLKLYDQKYGAVFRSSSKSK